MHKEMDVHTMRIISEQWSKRLSWVRDTGCVLSTDSVEVLLIMFQTGHLCRQRPKISWRNLSGGLFNPKQAMFDV